MIKKMKKVEEPYIHTVDWQLRLSIYHFCCWKDILKWRVLCYFLPFSAHFILFWLCYNLTMPVILYSDAVGVNKKIGRNHFKWISHFVTFSLLKKVPLILSRHTLNFNTFCYITFSHKPSITYTSTATLSVNVQYMISCPMH